MAKTEPSISEHQSSNMSGVGSEDLVECRWYLNFLDGGIVDPAGYPRWQRELVISTSPEKGQGQVVLRTGPFVASDPQLYRQHKIFEYLMEIHNYWVGLKPRNINQGRDASGRFVRKQPQTP
ncbi:MAG TPA: hypothetical protein VGO18_34110 [Steroidobacteraceae bacterium]|nr:hypothetical protein [Steroidobacteraceae bacterium]